MEVAVRALYLAAIVVAAACKQGSGDAVAQGSAQADSLAPHAGDSPEKQPVLRARAFDRADNLDSARILYEEAARRAPAVRDWLLLRAAGVTRDRGDREKLLSRVELPVAEERRKPTEAIALERSGDVAGAITAYSAAGDRLAAIRLGMLVPTDTVKMTTARRDLISFLDGSPGAQDARDAIALFDKSYKDATPAENLVVARAAFSAGSAARAVTSFGRAFAGGLGTTRDRFNNGNLLARLNRDKEAIAEFARVSSPEPLAAAARYQRARALLALGRRDEARTLLRQITTSFPSDTSAASSLLLLSDLATDDGRDADARSTLLTVAQKYPRTRHAPVALFRAGIIAYVARDYKSAAKEFDSVVAQYPNADDALASGYWSGRAMKARGDTAAANARWRALLVKERGSYYSVQSAARLGVPLLADQSKEDRFPTFKDIDAASERIAQLKDFGMDTEANFEYDRLYRDGPTTPQRLVATARALAGTDQSMRSMALGRRAVNEIGPSAQNYRLQYPVLERETLIQSSKANGLDPRLVAALIRQESSFNPRATSPVGARGLMQLMPPVGRTLASSQRIPGYSDESLYNAAVNIKLGTRHLKGLFGKTSTIEKILAAYNAGESRVTRWSQKAGAGDPEMFTERIPFVETRDYVRSIIRNRAFYSALYSWE
ncbi:MAG TPA: transglycosylase SLT domain-containing protein [Gemmatimonadaceae bacterium]|nr:transglycosylase SLT domain-containing protein [Gemmatimonadaceae bacterium]